MCVYGQIRQDRSRSYTVFHDVPVGSNIKRGFTGIFRFFLVISQASSLKQPLDHVMIHAIASDFH